MLLQITTLGIFHHNVQKVLLDEAAIVTNDVGVVNSSQDLNLLDCLALVFVRHMTSCDLFDAVKRVRCLMVYAIDNPKTASSYLI
jgi:hypothetical protein